MARRKKVQEEKEESKGHESEVIEVTPLKLKLKSLDESENKKLVNEIKKRMEKLEELKEISDLLDDDLDKLIAEIIRDWCIRNGISIDGIKSIYGVPIITKEDIVEITESRDLVDPALKINVYRVKGFNDIRFEELNLRFYDIREACKAAKIRMDIRNLMAIILKENNYYKVLVERYSILKDKSISKRFRFFKNYIFS